MAEPLEQLHLLRDGTWLHDGTRVRHARLAALLHRSIARDEEGALIVTTGRDRLPFTCDDAPVHVRTVRRDGDHWWLVLAGGEEEELPAGAVLLMDEDGRVRSRVRGDAFWALFSRGATQALLAVIDDEQRVPVAGGHARVELLDAPRDWSA